MASMLNGCSRRHLLNRDRDREGLLHPLAGPTDRQNLFGCARRNTIGPDVGSRGTAAHFRRPIAVTDIFADPLWIPYRPLADILVKEHGVKACWSSPILRSDDACSARSILLQGQSWPHARRTHDRRRVPRPLLAGARREEVKADNQRLAFFDNLTGFGNRANFLKTLEAAVDRASAPLSVLLVDIDHLGRVNDAFGHATGDRLILEVGQTVARIAAPAAIFRVDADEFAVLIENRSATDLSAVSAEILRAMENRTPQRDEHLLPVSVTCGGATFEPSGPPDVPTFLQHANLALHHAKQTARGGFVLYSDDLAGAIANRFRALQTVTSALAEDRIEAHYQPIVSLPTQEIIGLEALCRIRTDGGQILSPGAFAEALQDPSVGYLLTDRMLEQVARDIRYWLDLGPRFNMSASTYRWRISIRKSLRADQKRFCPPPHAPQACRARGHRNGLYGRKRREGRKSDRGASTGRAALWRSMISARGMPRSRIC